MMVKKLAMLLIAFLFVGCASIPPESPELSIELGKRISAIEDANIKLLHRFFDHKRKDVDTFLESEWVPTFTETFFSNQIVSSAWNSIVQGNNKEKRLDFLVTVGKKLQNKINSKRVELMEPLTILEQKIANSIRSEYSQARAINSSISSFLLSASEVEQNRNRYLDMLGMTDIKISKAIDTTDNIVSELLQKGKNVSQKVDKAEAFISQINSLKDSL